MLFRAVSTKSLWMVSITCFRPECRFYHTKSFEKTKYWNWTIHIFLKRYSIDDNSQIIEQDCIKTAQTRLNTVWLYAYTHSTCINKTRFTHFLIMKTINGYLSSRPTVKTGWTTQAIIVDRADNLLTTMTEELKIFILCYFSQINSRFTLAPSFHCGTSPSDSKKPITWFVTAWGHRWLWHSAV